MIYRYSLRNILTAVSRELIYILANILGVEIQPELQNHERVYRFPSNSIPPPELINFSVQLKPTR
jgi:hypothetical protein